LLHVSLSLVSSYPHARYWPERCSRPLLITTETPDERRFNSALTIDSEVSALYGARYRIDLLHGQSSFKRDPANPDEPKMSLEEKVYLIKRH
jgi:hypothetical protein